MSAAVVPVFPQGRARAHRAAAARAEALRRGLQGADGGARQDAHCARQLLERPQAADPQQGLHSWLSLPATDDPTRDLEIFEKLMAMDDESFVVRWKRRPKPKEILAHALHRAHRDYFTRRAGRRPADVRAGGLVEARIRRRSKSRGARTSPSWSAAGSKRRCCPACPIASGWTRRSGPRRSMDTVHDHIWDAVNAHLGTSAHSFPELVEQLGIMRFGHRPRVADTFCGSGQIPFEAARLGCDVYASDLNPVACMLTWGAFNIVGGSVEEPREAGRRSSKHWCVKCQAEIDQLGVETDGNGWRAKVFLYCVEVRCPQTGWMVPLLPTSIVSKGYAQSLSSWCRIPTNKRYDIVIRIGRHRRANWRRRRWARCARDGRGQEPYLIHIVGWHRVPDQDLDAARRLPQARRNDRQSTCGCGTSTTSSRGRTTSFKSDSTAIQWMRPKSKGKADDYEFRSVTDDRP